MVEIAKGPTITCPAFIAAPIAVIATYATRDEKGNPIPPFPVAGATVTLFYSAAVPIIVGTTPYYSKTTNLVGLAESCFTTGYFVEARIQKTGVDFGSGVGVQHKIGSKSGIDRVFSNTFFIEARTPPPGYVPPKLPPVVVPCVGTIDAAVPDIKEMLKGFTTLPSGIFVRLSTTVNGVPRNIPFKITVTPPGREYVMPAYEANISNREINVLNIIQSFGAEQLNKEHKIKIESLLPDCEIYPKEFTIPPLIPTGIPPVAPCTWKTQAGIDIPSILQLPFNISIANANWLCNGESTPINATAEVFIGAMKFYLPISAGSGSLSLSQYDITSIISAGVGVIPTIPEIPTPIPTLPAGCDKTGRVSDVAELQAWLTSCYPGKGYIAEGTGPLWKINRPVGTYFWGNKYEDIRAVLRGNP